MSDPWLHRLSEYIDDELLPEERDELQEHLADCETCSATLEELHTVVAHAGELEDQFPENDLWPAIAEQLDATDEALPAVEADEPTRSVRRATSPAPTRIIAFSTAQLLIACLAVMILSGSMGWLAASLRAPGTTPVAEQVAQDLTGSDALRDDGSIVLTPAAADTDPLTLAMVQYELSIEQLEKTLLEREAFLDPMTFDVISENLRAIDEAIFESRQALKRSPESEYLHAHLASSIKRKVRMLRQATNLAGTQI